MTFFLFSINFPLPHLYISFFPWFDLHFHFLYGFCFLGALDSHLIALITHPPLLFCLFFAILLVGSLVGCTSVEPYLEPYWVSWKLIWTMQWLRWRSMLSVMGIVIRPVVFVACLLHLLLLLRLTPLLLLTLLQSIWSFGMFVLAVSPPSPRKGMWLFISHKVTWNKLPRPLLFHPWTFLPLISHPRSSAGLWMFNFSWVLGLFLFDRNACVFSSY